MMRDGSTQREIMLIVAGEEFTRTRDDFRKKQLTSAKDFHAA